MQRTPLRSSPGAAIPGGDGGCRLGNAMIGAVPGHKSGDPVLDARVRCKACRLPQTFDIGPGGRYVPRLHRQVAPVGLAPERRFDGGNEALELDRCVIAEVINRMSGSRLVTVRGSG